MKRIFFSLAENIIFVFAFLITIVCCCGSCSTKNAVGTPDKIDFHNVKEFYLSSIPDSLKYLVPLFDSILCADQKFRENNNPNLFLQNIQEQNILDSLNYSRIGSIIDRYGILGRSDFGFKGNLAVRSVLQHAPLQIQEKYLPAVLDALDKNNLPRDFVAMYLDRIDSRNKKPQKYGTQLRYNKGKYLLYPVLNFDSLNVWRKEMNLISIEDYFKIFKTEFSKESYKKQLPELERLFKVNVQK